MIRETETENCSVQSPQSKLKNKMLLATTCETLLTELSGCKYNRIQKRKIGTMVKWLQPPMLSCLQLLIFIF